MVAPQVPEVRSHGREVEGVVPRPACHPVVVVTKHPAQAFDVRRHAFCPGHLGVIPAVADLLLVVPLLPLLEPHRVPVDQQSAIVRRHHCRPRGHLGRRRHRRALPFGPLRRRTALSAEWTRAPPGIHRGRSKGELLEVLLVELHYLLGCDPLRAPGGILLRLLGAFGLEVLCVLGAVLQHLLLELPQAADEHFEAIEVQVPRAVGEVPPAGGRRLLVHLKHCIERALADVEGRQVGEEIVAHEHAHEDKVVDHPLQVVPVGPRFGTEFDIEVVPQQPHLQEHEALLRRAFERVAQGPATVPPTEGHHLAQQAEVRLVRHQRQHDEVSIQAVHAVALVGRPSGLQLL
mmetsp:Transcript_69774/g.220992  ORF Transcript_69774/g.220992 Transcript_69774/m.220992 type:complete len:347 (+) Transcript_69774:2910-3950(+)